MNITPDIQTTKPLTLKQAVHIKAAEFWLQSKSADEALRELENLSEKAWNHPTANKIRLTALEMLGEVRR